MLRHAPFSPGLSAYTLAICGAVALPSAFAADFPTGTYSAKKAPYTVSFDNKGQFQVNKSGTLEVSGNYTLQAGELQLTDTDGPWACTKAGEQTGTYAWKYQNAVLTLTKVSDKCEDRVNSLVNLAWRQQK